MKKTVILIGLVLLAVSGTFAQVSVAGKTYYYKYVATEDSGTGVRSKGSDRGFYLTFTTNACYESDAKGIKTGLVYNYQKDDGSRINFLYRDIEYGEFNTVNNAPVYTPYGSYQGTSINSQKVITKDYQKFFSFSKDYKKFSVSIYHGATGTTGVMSNAYGMVYNDITPGKAAYWEKGIDIYEQSTPPPPPKTKEELDREAQEKLAPPKVNF